MALGSPPTPGLDSFVEGLFGYGLRGFGIAVYYGLIKLLQIGHKNGSLCVTYSARNVLMEEGRSGKAGNGNPTGEIRPTDLRLQ